MWDLLEAEGGVGHGRRAGRINTLDAAVILGTTTTEAVLLGLLWCVIFGITWGAGLPIVRISTRVTCAKDRIAQIRDDGSSGTHPPGLANDEFYGSTTYLRRSLRPRPGVTKALGRPGFRLGS